jgi:hypothetical protein
VSAVEHSQTVATSCLDCSCAPALEGEHLGPPLQPCSSTSANGARLSLPSLPRSYCCRPAVAAAALLLSRCCATTTALLLSP